MNNGMLNISSCDVGFSIDGTNYTFEGVDGVTIEDPRKSHLVRGVNSKGSGLLYKEGTGSPFVVTATLKGISQALVEVLDGVKENDTRIDFWVIERATGTNKMFKNAGLQNAPKQLNISEGEDSLTVEIVIEAFDYTADFRE